MENKNHMIGINTELRDMIISAFRYSLGRQTYITDETCSFIMKHPELINERVKCVMLKDLQELDSYYPSGGVDFYVFKGFEEWLVNLEVKD